jgi:cytosine/adenosine deaminase-related metal-dependent hydrolase
MRGRMLVRGGRLLTMDRRLGDLDPGDVLIEDGRIRDVAPRLEADDADTLDAEGMIVLPGFVDAHRHVWQTQLRTVAADWSLFDYFVRMRSIYAALYEPEDVYLGNRVGALEALGAGITTIVDHCHVLNSPEHVDEAVRGLRDAGIRGVFCYGLFPNPRPPAFAPAPDDGWRAGDLRRTRARHFASHDDLLLLGLAPTEAEAMPLEALEREIGLGRDVGAHRISLHVAMGAYDRGRRLVAALADRGLLGDDLLFVHGAALGDDELDRIAAAGAAVTSTPETELQMAMGHPVAWRALARGARASLGIDIVSNFAGDMFAQMRLLLQAERGLRNAALTSPPHSIGPSAREVLELATIGGAEAMGLGDRVGSLTPGKQADLVLVRTDAVHMTPATDPIGAVVLYAGASDVDTVLVGGRVVQRAGEPVGVSWPTLRDRLLASSARIRAGASAAPREQIEEIAAGFML